MQLTVQDLRDNPVAVVDILTWTTDDKRTAAGIITILKSHAIDVLVSQCIRLLLLMML